MPQPPSPEFPAWLEALSHLHPDQVSVSLHLAKGGEATEKMIYQVCVSHQYHIPPGDFVDQAIQEKIQRELKNHPEIEQLLRKAKKPVPN